MVVKDKFADVDFDVRKGWIGPRPENPPEEVQHPMQGEKKVRHNPDERQEAKRIPNPKRK